jgi:hypothetical protein
MNICEAHARTLSRNHSGLPSSPLELTKRRTFSVGSVEIATLIRHSVPRWGHKYKEAVAPLWSNTSHHVLSLRHRSSSPRSCVHSAPQQHPPLLVEGRWVGVNICHTDRSLRKLFLFQTVGYAGTINNGYDGSLLNGRSISDPADTRPLDDAHL